MGRRIASETPAEGSLTSWLPGRTALRLLFWTVLPLVLITAVGEVYRAYLAAHDSLRGANVPFDFAGYTTWRTAFHLVVDFWWPRDGQYDSWRPMYFALEFVNSGRQSGLYDATFLQYRFQYPPTALLFLQVFQWLGWIGSFDALHLALNRINAIMMLVNAATLSLLAFRLTEPSAIPNGRSLFSHTDRYWMAGLVFALGLVIGPLALAFMLGQIQVWLNTLLALGCLAWLSGRRGWAGVCFALLCLVKPQLWLLVLWGGVWRQWGFIRGFVAVAIPATLLSITLYGWDNHVEYLDALSHLSRFGESYFANQSVNGLLHRFLFEGPNTFWGTFAPFPPFNPFVYAASVISGIAFIALALLPAAAPGRRAPGFLDLGLAVTCFTLGSPIAWDHHYALLFPFYMVLLVHLLAKASAPAIRTRLVLLFVSWALFANIMTFLNVFADSRLNVLQSYRFFGGLIFVWLLASETRCVPAMKNLASRLTGRTAEATPG